MKTRTDAPYSRSVPATYAELMRMHMIRLIRDELEYEEGLRIAERFAGREDLNRDQEDYFELLCRQIEKYENQAYPIESQGDPVGNLRFLLENNEMNASDLGRLLGSRQLGTAILRGERQLSKTHIRILADRFKVSADLFL